MNNFADDTTLYCTLARMLYDRLRKRIGSDVADKALNPFGMGCLRGQFIDISASKSLATITPLVRPAYVPRLEWRHLVTQTQLLPGNQQQTAYVYGVSSVRTRARSSIRRSGGGSSRRRTSTASARPAVTSTPTTSWVRSTTPTRATVWPARRTGRTSWSMRWARCRARPTPTATARPTPTTAWAGRSA